MTSDNKFPLREVAAKMREQNESPRDDMNPADYYTASAIHAVIEGMEALADSLEGV